VTIEGLLEDIVCDFTTNISEVQLPDIQVLEEVWHIIEGSASIRDSNRTLEWELPTDGPKTLNGFIMEHLETIPKGHISFTVGDYRFETQSISSTMIESARVQLITLDERVEIEE